MNAKLVSIFLICNAVICISIIAGATISAIHFNAPVMMLWYLLVLIVAYKPNGTRS